MKSGFLKVMAVVTTLAALAGCGGGGPKPPTVQQEQATQAQQITDLKAELAKGRRITTLAQLAEEKAAIDKSGAAPAAIQAVDAIIAQATGYESLETYNEQIAGYFATSGDYASQQAVLGAIARTTTSDSPLVVALGSLDKLESAVNDLATTQAVHTADINALEDAVAADAAAIQALTKQITDMQTQINAQAGQLAWLYADKIAMAGIMSTSVGVSGFNYVYISPTNVSNLPKFATPRTVTLTVDGGLTFDATGTDTQSITYTDYWQPTTVHFTGITAGTWTVTATCDGMTTATYKITVN